MCGILGGNVLPSPDRVCPDTEGDGVGLGGKSDIMPCNLFLRFSEPSNRRETQNIQSCREEEDDEEARTHERQASVDRSKNVNFIQKCNTNLNYFIFL